MKRPLKIFLSIIIICIISYYSLAFILVNGNDTSKDFKKLGYNEAEIEIINTLSDPSILLNYDYNENYIKFIGHKDFKEENFKKYIQFYSTYSFSIDNVIYVINSNFYKSDVTYTETAISLIKEPYYINDNLDRYINYYNDHSDLTLKDVITNVNSNIDYDFYTNTKETDLSKGYLILVNKYNYLSKDYVPDNLVNIEAKYGVTYQLESTVYEQYKKMWEDASNNGLSLYINSPYRSYNTQNSLYHNYGTKDGYTLADTYSARAGFSEHQTGLAIDITSKTSNFSSFENTNEFAWLKDNAHKYGFILRYPKDKEYITGYQYEPWHYRYVGIDIATKIKELNITYEEYYAYFVK